MLSKETLPDKTIKIHEQAILLSKKYQTLSSQIIEVLIEIDKDQTFKDYECTSLFNYCTRYMNFSDDVAYNFITVARKVCEVPELKSEVEEGRITLTKARKICSVLNSENKSYWFDKARNLTQKTLEKAVAKVDPKAAVVEKLHYVTEERLKLEVGVSEEFCEKLKTVQSIISQKKKVFCNREMALEMAVDLFLEKMDPIKKAKRIFNSKKKKTDTKNFDLKSKDENKHQLVLRRVDDKNTKDLKNKKRKSRTLSANLKHKINLRDKRRCVYVDLNGKRCENTFWVDFHHMTPISKGGVNSEKNIVTLCSSHHRLIHRKDKEVVYFEK